MLFAGVITSCSTAFKPTFCDIVGIKKLHCFPTDSVKEEYELRTLDALGYRCVSPDDWREGKKRLRKLLELEK